MTVYRLCHYRNKNMFFGNTELLVTFVIGMILMLIGFGFRDRNPGMILLGLGFLATIFVLIKKAIELFS